MDIERKTVVQVAVSVTVGLLFVVGLVGLSSVYGSEITHDDEPLAGVVAGELGEPDEGAVPITGELEGEFENRTGGLRVGINGTIAGTVDDGTLNGSLTATIEDSAADGTVAGSVDGTVEDGSFSGDFQGSVDATDQDTSVTPTGGLALVGLIAAFIIGMPVVGYLIERTHE